MATFNRRGFLATVLGALSTGAIGNISVPEAALADPVTNRYARVVQLQQRVYAANREALAYRAKMPLNSQDQAAYKTALASVNQQGNELFAFMLANFPAKDSVDIRWAISDVLAGRVKHDVLNAKELSKLLNEVLVVAVAKHSLVQEKCLFETHKMPQFFKFAEVYRELLLDGRRPSDMVAVMYPESWKQEHQSSDQALLNAQARWSPNAEREARDYMKRTMRPMRA